MIADAELSEMEARCLAATPGPWKSSVEGRDHVAGDTVILRWAGEGYDDLYLNGGSIADYDFVAAAREDLPRLIEEVRRLRGLLNSVGVEVQQSSQRTPTPTPPHKGEGD